MNAKAETEADKAYRACLRMLGQNPDGDDVRPPDSPLLTAPSDGAGQHSKESTNVVAQPPKVDTARLQAIIRANNAGTSRRKREKERKLRSRRFLR
jgi:hypothetical protein